ncbi:hypothetical protein KA005_83370 [bacterium]|nr:hypothetical protein [bacterium]
MIRLPHVGEGIYYIREMDDGDGVSLNGDENYKLTGQKIFRLSWSIVSLFIDE